MKKRQSIFDIILRIIIWLLAILIIYWAIELLFGGSPTLGQFNFTLIVLVIGFFIKIYREIGEMKMEMKYNFAGIKNSFDIMKNDMGVIKNKLNVK